MPVRHARGSALWTRDAWHTAAERHCTVDDPFVYLAITTMAHDHTCVDDCVRTTLKRARAEFNKDC